jgi:hypothetical protein
MKVILFTNARDEYNIDEWVFHHLNLGFDHIYITDHKSTIPIKFKLNNITINRQDNNIIKSKLIKSAVKYAKDNNYNWMLYIDCDEFLVLNNNSDVKSYLTNYDSYNQVSLNWLMFGSNYHNINLNNLIIENYTKSDLYLDHHLKSFLKISSINIDDIITYHPHVYIMNNMELSCTTNLKSLIKGTEWWCDQDNITNVDINAYIAHYIYQSYETYIKRKVIIKRDDTGEYRDEYTIENFHKLYNNKDNYDVFNKYNEINRKSINDYYNRYNIKDTIWNHYNFKEDSKSFIKTKKKIYCDERDITNILKEKCHIIDNVYFIPFTDENKKLLFNSTKNIYINDKKYSHKKSLFIIKID